MPPTPKSACSCSAHHVESAYAMRLLADHPERSGYLLKDRISDIAVLTDALQRLTEGESVVDPTIVTRLIRRPGPDPLADSPSASARC